MKTIILLVLLLIPYFTYASVDLTGPVAPRNEAFVCMVDDDMVCDQSTTAGYLLESDGVSFQSVDPTSVCIAITGSADLCDGDDAAGGGSGCGAATGGSGSRLAERCRLVVFRRNVDF